MVYLLLGALLLPQRPRAARPWVALGVYACAGVTRGLVIAVLSASLGLVPAPEWGFRVVGATVLGMCWFSLAAIIIDAWSRNQAVLDELSDREALAASQRANAESRLRQTRERINDTLVTRLVEMTSLLTMVAQRESDPLAARRIAHEMHATVADVVRPLSHALAAPEPVALQSSRGRPRHISERARRWLRSITVDALTIDPYHPVITALVVTPSAIPAAVRAGGLVAGLLSAGALGLVVYSVLAVARRWHATHPRTPGRWSWIPAVAVYLIVGVSSALVSIVAALAVQDWIGPAWISGAQVLLILTPVAALGAALVSAEDRRRTVGEREREAAVATAEWTSHRVQQEAWAANRLLARELHGGVQSELTAAALRLEAWSQRPDPTTISDLLAQVRHALDHVRDLVDAGIASPPLDPRTAIDSISAVWASLAEVTSRIDDGAVDALLRDEAATESVVEVVRESLSNAVRHGRATRVTILITTSPAPGRTLAIGVFVADNGVGVRTTARDGFGSRLFDQVCLSWDRVSQPGETRVSARIPASVNPPVEPSGTISA
jgi:signal transduction histidine kinase